MIDLDGVERDCASAIDSGDGFVHLFSAEDVMDIIARLRQAEKDAARYRWIKENSQLGVGRCGVDWELYFEGPAPDNSAMIERRIDEAMKCK